MSDYEQFMRRTFALALQAKGRTSPNPLVGALILQGENIVGEGYHQKAGTDHAEIVALKMAGEKAQGGTMVVNLEPCCHYGRTPPCTQALLQSGITRVVVAMRDPNPLVAGKGLVELRQAGIEVVEGVLEAEAQQLNEWFVKYITTGLPFVLLKVAATLDGKIATKTGESQWITGECSRAYGHKLRDEYDAILVGINTICKDNPRLTTRLADKAGRDPARVVVDSQLRIPLDAQVITTDSPARVFVATTAQAPVEKKQRLEERGVVVLTVPDRKGRVDLQALLSLLGQEGIMSVLVEGGSEIHASFLQAHLADKMIFFIAPKLLGGRDAPGMVGGEGIAHLRDAIQLEKIRLDRCGEDIVVEGYIRQKETPKLCLLESSKKLAD